MTLFKVDMCCACGMHTADTSHQQQMLIADGEIACTVIGDPAPLRIWHPRVKSPIGILEPLQCFWYPPTNREFGIPMQNSLD